MRYPFLVLAVGMVSAGCGQLPTSPTAPGGTAMAEEATQARGGADLPFRGSFEGTEVDQVVPPNLLVNGTADGTATHLGRYTATFTVVVDLATSSSIGSIVLVAANGDELTGTFTGQGTASAPECCAHHRERDRHRWHWPIRRSGTFTIDRTLDQLTGRSSGSLTDGFISLGS